MAKDNRQQSNNIDFLGFGKIPPQCIDLEKAVLGALLIQSEAIFTIIEIITPESFYEIHHQTIYNAILILSSKLKPIDILTVTQQLKSTEELDEIGGELYLAQLTDNIATSSHLEFHARIIQQNSIRRQFIRVSAEIQKMSFDETADIDDLIQFVERSVYEVTDVTVKKEAATTETLVVESLNRLEQRARQDDKFNGVPSGFTSLDRITGGFQLSDLIIIAARPAMGKSALVLNMARNMAIDYKIPTALFSLEMAATQLSDRLIIGESEINSDKFRTGSLNEYEWTRIETCSVDVQSPNLIIDDTPSLSIFEFRSKCRKLMRNKNLGCIIIDYLQLMTIGFGFKGNREQEVSFISRSLKSIAKELNVPIIALSQLNRAVESRSGNKRPQLSDLRESGCLIGDTQIQCPKLKKTFSIKDLIHRKRFSILATNFKKIKEMEANKSFCTGNKEVFELTLLNDQKIEATSEHKFLTPNEWVKLKDLNLDKVAIPINYGDYDDNSISKHEISLIGHFLSNGSALKRQPIRYAQNILDGDLTEVVMNDALIASNYNISPYFNDTYTAKSKFRTIFFKPNFHLTYGKRSPMSEIMRKYDLWDVRCKQKFIPDRLFYLSHENTHILLKSLFSGDGTVYYQESKGRKSLKISYSSASIKLIYGIQQLLAKVGIVSFISHLENSKNQKWSNLYIAGKSNIELFVKNIGFWQKRKNDILMNGWESSKNNLAGWNKYEFNEERTLCFMPVKSIISKGVKKVFDIEVPELHNFIANNIIVHNSIEQDADMVMFIHRPEYYGITENENHESTKGLAEIIVAKYRNGSTGIVDLRFNQNFIKFTDVNRDDPF